MTVERTNQEDTPIFPGVEKYPLRNRGGGIRDGTIARNHRVYAFVRYVSWYGHTHEVGLQVPS
jgi:hypothetical protein